MSEVQNIGTADYAQYQPSVYQNEEYPAENYNIQPELYDERAVQLKEANRSRLGATILSSLVVAGIGVGGYFIGKHGKVSSKDLEKLNATAKKYAEAQKAMNEIEKIAEQHAGDFFGTKRIGREFYNTIKDLFKPFKEVAEKSKEKVEDKTKKSA